MANFYKKIKLSFRGNFPLISDRDEALKNPYHLHDDGYDFELNKPGDNSTSGYGTDYYSDKKPPPSSSRSQYATRPKWNGSFDGEDPNLNDQKPSMDSGSSLYDLDSPIGRSQIIQRRENKVDRDNTGVGPFNQSSMHKTDVFFDNIRRRLRD